MTLTMSVKERTRLEMFSRVKRGEISVGQAARLLEVSERQGRRLWRRYRREGDGGLIHRLRGRPSNAGKGEERSEVLAICRAKYADFGSALAAEYLAKEGYAIPRTTLWRWRRESGDLGPRRRSSRHRIRRERRACIGELVQMDGSTHDWFEGRGPVCVLFVLIDDASNRLFCRFYASEDTASAFEVFGRYVRKHGLPRSLYVDRDSIYRVNDPPAREEARDRGQKAVTQFGRAMDQLGVGMIFAHSPQAKGRVERVNGTLQDRLVKAMRLAGLSTIEQANAFLEEQFLPEHHRRFTRPAAKAPDVHRALPTGVRLAEVLCVQESRTVGRDWCVSFEGRVLQLDRRHAKLSLAGRWITVRKLASGALQLSSRGHRLKWTELATRPTPPMIATPASSVRVPPLRTPGLRPPSTRRPWRPASTHPWRSPFVQAPSLRSDSRRSSSLRSGALTSPPG